MNIDRSSGRSLTTANGSALPKTLIVGLGNPILGDDGVGWRIAERLQEHLQSDPEGAEGLEVECLALGGLSLMERLVGYQCAILIDAITTHQNPPGTLRFFPLESLPENIPGHTTAAHDTSLKTAIEMGRSLGACLPEKIIIVAVEAEQVYNFTEELSPQVAAAVITAEQMVLDIIRQGGPQ
jgi:hydrogenase maturation protease